MDIFGDDSDNEGDVNTSLSEGQTVDLKLAGVTNAVVIDVLRFKNTKKLANGKCHNVRTVIDDRPSLKDAADNYSSHQALATSIRRKLTLSHVDVLPTTTPYLINSADLGVCFYHVNNCQDTHKSSDARTDDFLSSVRTHIDATVGTALVCGGMIICIVSYDNGTQPTSEFLESLNKRVVHDNWGDWVLSTAPNSTAVLSPIDGIVDSSSTAAHPPFGTRYYQLVFRRTCASIDINTYAPPAGYGVGGVAGVSQWKVRPEALARERENINQISVFLSTAEKQTGVLTLANHAQAVRAMNDYGLCIIKNIFDPDTLVRYGDDAVLDFQDAITVLQKKKGIDLTANKPSTHVVTTAVSTSDQEKPKPKPKPKVKNALINNFYELSMREQHRCDLRYGPRMKALSAAFRKLAADNASNTAAEPESACRNIYNHTGITAVLDEVMFPKPGPDHNCSIGNWGRWNFEQSGASAKHSPPPLERSEVGAVMTLPGCQDQTIHADTPHLYEHLQLPGHYINLFMPAARREVLADLRLGQTAFVCKSHIMMNSAKMMLAAMLDTEGRGIGEECGGSAGAAAVSTDCGGGIGSGRISEADATAGEIWLEDELIRPHLQLGDCLLFDCRILHLGLGNYTSLPTAPALATATAPTAAPTTVSSSSDSASTTIDTNNTTADDDDHTGDDDNAGHIRPMLYVNHHYNWFHDRKNWNRDDVLFECNKRDI